MVLTLLAAACGEAHPGPAPSPRPSPSSRSTASPAAVASPAPAAAGVDWPEYLGGPGRFGIGPSTPALDSVKQVWAAALDGVQYAEPLIAFGQVLAATQNDTVYSFDSATGAVTWKVHLGEPVPRSSLPCGNIDTTGITSTPTIDSAGTTIYVVTFQQPAHHVLYALELKTGAIRWQRGIDPPLLSPLVHQQRGALTFSRGRVYVPYGGLYGDCGDYRGWVVAAASDGAGDLLSYQVKATREAGIWAPGGAVVDPAGNLYVAVGNAEPTSGFNYGNSVIRLTPDLKEADFWAPSDWASLNNTDTDIGSITPSLLENGSLFQAGKAGIGYLVRTDHMGGIGGEVFSARVCNGLDFGAVAYSAPYLFVPCRGVGITALRVGSDRFDVAWKSSGGGYTPVLAGGWLWTIGGSRPATLVQVSLDTGAVHARIPLAAVANFATISAGEGRIFVPAWDQLLAFGPA